MVPKVSINLLNWNQVSDTMECIASCQNIDYGNYEILVIDNASTDHSVELIKQKFKQIQLIKTDENLGYAGGNNVGIKHALKRGADFVLLLNNDLVVEPNLINELVNTFVNHPKAGLAAPKVMYYQDRSVINSLGTSMDWLRLRPFLGYCNQKDVGQVSTIKEKDILVGCAILVSKETVARIGLLDENFFLVHEEADWCYRNLKSGFKNIVVPHVVVYHKVSKSLNQFPQLAHYYTTRNILYLAQKNAASFERLMVYFGLFYLLIKNFLIFLFRKNERHRARAFLLGVNDYLAKRMGKCSYDFGNQT